MKSLRALAAVVAVILFGLVGYYLYDTLRPRTTAEKLAGIIHLEDQRQLTDQFTDYLNDDTTRVRQRACLAIGRIAAPRSGDLLIDMLADPSLDVASTAAFAIGLTGEHNLALTLLDAAGNLPASVTAPAVLSAGRLADSSDYDVIDELATFLVHPAPEVREAACYGLFHTGNRTAAEQLIPLLDGERDRAVQYAALYTLSRMGIEKAKPVYVQFQADSDPEFRMLAVRGLGTVRDDDAIRSIALSLNDNDSRVVAQAVASLIDRQEPRAAEYIANKLPNEDDENLIVLMLNALRAKHSSLGESTAEMHFKASLSNNLTAAALGYLAEIRGDRIVALVDSLRTENLPARVRAACAAAYGEVDNNSVVPRLAMLFTDEDPMVRAAAFRQLIRIDSTNLDLYLKDALRDPDIVPRVLALDQIGRRRKVEYLPQVTSMMERSDTLDVDIRRSLVDVVDQFINVLGADSVMAELVVKGLFDPDYVVRHSAAEVYKARFDRDRFNMVTPAETRISERRIRKALENYTANPTAVIVTEKGDIEFELLFDAAPLTILNFIELASDDFYKGLIFHRVVPDFVVQGGDPRGDGWGGPDYFIRDEFSDRPFERGTVGIATSGHDTGGSQFFITHSPQPHLNARYTVFGQVIKGFDVVDRISVGDVIEEVIIKDK